MAVDIVKTLTKTPGALPGAGCGTDPHELDRYWMERAIELAQEARGYTSPNPLVGAIVLDAAGRLVGADYHHRAGQPHAERLALAQAGEAARGGTLYVTLEPCCHFGRTPPCTEAIIASGVRRVVVAMQDPNPRVAGKGFAALREAGIEVTVGVAEEQARRLNEAFCKYITTGLPFGLWKVAMSLDGKIAARTGDSRWISSPESRAEVHELRQAADAILVGSGTILSDDPLLTTRRANGKPGRDARPILVDSRGRIPPSAKVLTVPRNPPVPPLIVTTRQAPAQVRAAWERAGAEVWVLPEDDSGHVDLVELNQRLGACEITSILIESGGTLAEAALRAGMIDRVLVYIAPILIGGTTSPTALGGTGVERLAEAWQLVEVEVGRSGTDIRVTGRVRYAGSPGQKGMAGVEGDDGRCSPE
ncbi:MAG: bifunctional diaminohydroxyphosphoribosylaminopyrimidine deaminase/5-amino-6-(5-phosphoribosylamino)uracil reductase RibD [Limnochordales bacterium]|nr:bifunctional diaminohydroxyphosphoribosylaminopyrimidine deaminase/5-amino-6-(5-phosphoribosylamino)uracil reductase RibD [Limnochordales bacterium]